MTSMKDQWKQLFEAPPQHVVQSVLSKQRKMVYALIAFGPGTLLGLYLRSVEKEMDRENEKRRLKHITQDRAEEEKQEARDLVVKEMIQDLRDRIRRLEEEAIAARQQQQKQQAAPSSTASPTQKIPSAAAVATPPVKPRSSTPLPPTIPTVSTDQPPLDAVWWKDAVNTLSDGFAQFQSGLEQAHARFFTPNEKEVPAPSVHRSREGRPSGIRERVRVQEDEAIARDVRHARELRHAAAAGKQINE